MEEKGIWNKVKGMIPSDILFVLPNKDGENHIYSINRKKFMVLTGVTLFCAVLLVGLAGFYGWQYHHMAADRVAYQEYLAHKTEQNAKLQSLLDDNEKMLRDMSEIHTLETKLRRAVIQNGGDKEFTSNIDAVGATEGARSTDPGYSGKGGPGADISMLEVVAAQDKNLAAQIDGQRKK